MDYESKLKEFIAAHGIRVEHIHFEKSVHSVQEACVQAHAQPDDFVKSICMIGKNNKTQERHSTRTIVALVLGSQRASTTRVTETLGFSVRIATPEEALELTGYLVGGTPPFGYPATFLIDSSVMEKQIVYAGGGAPNALIRISPEEIKRVNNGIIICVRK